MAGAPHHSKRSFRLPQSSNSMAGSLPEFRRPRSFRPSGQNTIPNYKNCGCQILRPAGPRRQLKLSLMNARPSPSSVRAPAPSSGTQNIRPASFAAIFHSASTPASGRFVSYLFGGFKNGGASTSLGTWSPGPALPGGPRTGRWPHPLQASIRPA